MKLLYYNNDVDKSSFSLWLAKSHRVEEEGSNLCSTLELRGTKMLLLHRCFFVVHFLLPDVFKKTFSSFFVSS